MPDDEYTELLAMLKDLDSAVDYLKGSVRNAITTVETAKQTWSKDGEMARGNISYVLNSVTLSITRCQNRKTYLEYERDKRA